MIIPIGLVALVAVVVIAELGRLLVAKLFGYPPERHAIPIMKLPGIRGTTGFRLTLILAGPVAAYLAISMLAFLHFRSAGFAVAASARTVGTTVETFDAVSKLQPGDVILEVDGNTFMGSAAELAAQVEARNGAAVALTVERDGAKQTVTIQPKKAPDGRWRLGVTLDPRVKSTSASLKRAIVYPIDTTIAIASGLVALFKGSEDDDAGGPVRIAAEFRSEMSTSAFESTTSIAMLLGVYALLALALFDLVRVLLLVLFRS
ncbi:MAG: PDZ domain-containing protein [Deltaproteobacteria bacterium]|nr:PDZ domain-containing protein [Deltaproteobacteria bacterium]